MSEGAMAEEDTTIRISRDEKQVFDTARNIWEEANGRRISAGEFVRLLSARYLNEVGKSPPTTGVGTPMAARGVRPLEAETVSPGPQVYLVTCCRCGGQIAWRMDRGIQGCCPYCGVTLRLRI